MSHSANFLHQVEPEIENKRYRRRRLVRTLLVSSIILVVAWSITLVVVAGQVYAHVSDARDQLLEAKVEAQSLSFERAREILAGAQEDLSVAEGRLPILSSISWVPAIGRYVTSVSDLIRASSSIASALDPLFDLGEDMMQLAGVSQDYLDEIQDGFSADITFDDLSTETKRAVLSRLAASADEIDLLTAQVHIAQQEIKLLSGDVRVGPMLTLLDPVAVQLALLENQLNLLSIAARLLPAYAGLKEPSTNLLLFLNNSEMRPGGGFIGSYGILETFGGDISHLETADVYALDNSAASHVTTEPPSPLKEYNAATQWFFRDSNWSPDFPTSTAKGIELFLQEAGYIGTESKVPTTDHIDNVIALTPTFASKLLEITGGIEIGGQVFTAENIPDAIEYQVQFGFKSQGIPVSQRKEILGDLVDEMKSRLYQLSFDEWEQVFIDVRSALVSKQILLFSTDDQVQEVIERSGWGGSVTPGDVDTLMVVDANLASLKSDPAVNRTIKYTINKDDRGRFMGTVSVTYDHTGIFDFKTTRYRTYTRVYVPKGSELIEGSVETQTLSDLGLTSFGGFISIEPGQQKTLTFSFRLAGEVTSSIARGDYELDVIKQSGTAAHALTLDFDFDKNVTHADPAEAGSEWGDDLYRLNTILDQDLEVRVEL
ncbi:MAG: DUF4012 domain-containing protein [Parcubacteria group bacterium]|nr:DUF4012 domain-containing protein [Parcubacteria group bacterium]